VLKHFCAIAQIFLKEKVRGNAKRPRYHQMSRLENGLSFAKQYCGRKDSQNWDLFFWNSAGLGLSFRPVGGLREECGAGFWIFGRHTKEKVIQILFELLFKLKFLNGTVAKW